MAKKVFTGWRTVTPGKCSCCGSDDEWDCDGRGSIFCSCQTCSACSAFDGHEAGCPEVESEEEEAA